MSTSYTHDIIVNASVNSSIVVHAVTTIERVGSNTKSFCTLLITHGNDGRVWGWTHATAKQMVHSVNNPQQSFLHAFTFITLCTGQAYCLLDTSCLRHLNFDEQQGEQLPLLSRLCILYTVAGTRQVLQTQHNRRLVPPHLQHLAQHSCQLSCPHRHPHWVYCCD